MLGLVGTSQSLYLCSLSRALHLSAQLDPTYSPIVSYNLFDLLRERGSYDSPDTVASDFDNL
jgi:hypothetical protein